MNNYYYLIYLTEELKRNLNHAIFSAAFTVQKNRLDLYFEQDEKPIKLSVSVEPGKTGIFEDPYTPPGIKNTVRFFGKLEGCRVDNLQLADGDRQLTLTFDSGDRILFQLYGNNANVFLVCDGIIESSFKFQKRYNGRKAPEAHKPSVKYYQNLKGSARQKLISVNPLLPRNILTDLVTFFKLEDKSNEELIDFATELETVLLSQAEPGILSDGRICLLPDDFFPVTGKKILDSFNECIRSSYYFKTYLQKFEGRKSGLMSRLKKQEEKLKRKLKNLYGSDKSLERSKEYEKFGHLLMANLYIDTPPEASQLEVEDLYNEGKRIIIPLKRMSLSDNAALYYDKSREARIAYEKAGEMIKETEANLDKVSLLLNELAHIDSLRDLDKWIRLNEQELQGMGAGGPQGGQQRQPYRKIPVHGYELWIGKNAKSNDELLRDSHKEDIWLHARGYAGSHVIVRMHRKADFPEKHVLEKAASYAAKYSKGAGSSLIPVIYAKRKHVRKPRGAAPGQVKVTMEQVILTTSEK